MNWRPTALTPLRAPVFRLLWPAWLAANLSMWMNDVAAAFLMTSLTQSALLIALVQSAATLPVLLFGLPSGALADILNRRAFFAVTQLWVAVVAMALAVLALTDSLTAPLLLALVFANGIGTAMRMPVYAAIVPTIVPRSELQPALTLSGIAMNLSRIAGPFIAGAFIAGAGSHYVFILNSVMSIFAFALILRWRPIPKTNNLAGERFFAAMRVGLQHVSQSPRMRLVLLQTFLFFFQSISLIALLPLIARDLHNSGPSGYSSLLIAMGVGGITFALCLPRLLARLGRETLLYGGSVANALSAIGVIISPSISWAMIAMVVAGMSWLASGNALVLTAQAALPDWVRARGMAIYQMALMGGTASGAALWGYVANSTTVTTSIVTAALVGPLLMLSTKKLSPAAREDEDLTPVTVDIGSHLTFDFPPGAGPIMVTIEYLIDPLQAASFKKVMQQTRRERLRQGVLTWGLFRDISEEGRYIEYFMHENWIEYQRRFERLTSGDLRLRSTRLAFHIGSEPPRTERYVAS